ncbi:hypothetical protein AKJ16_DCAP26908 [Drosera capensis]
MEWYNWKICGCFSRPRWTCLPDQLVC